MTGRAESTAKVDQAVRDFGGSADGMPSGNGIIAPVTRDHRFQHYAPDRFSILRTASSAAERFEIRLHSLVHRETSQRLAIIPGKEILTVGRDLRIEVQELAVIDLAWPQLVSLRDDLTRVIAAAVPIAPDKTAERLAHLTAQIAVAEGQLSHLAWKAPEAAATPSAGELARLSDKIGMLVERLEPRAVARLQSPYLSGTETVRGTRGRWHVTAFWGVALLAGIVGLLIWSMAGDGLRAWSRLQPAGSERSSLALPSRSGELPPDVQPSPVPSMARAGGAATLAAPEPPPVPEASAPDPLARLTGPRADAASPSLQDGKPQEQTGAQEPPPALEAAVPIAPAPPAKEPNEQTDPPAAPLVAETPPPTQSGSAAVDVTSAPSKAAASHVAIHVTAETWLRVRDGAGQTYIARLLKAGETWPVPAIPGLVLTSGNSGATFVLIDGVSGPALGSMGVVRTEKLP